MLASLWMQPESIWSQFIIQRVGDSIAAIESSGAELSASSRSCCCYGGLWVGAQLSAAIQTGVGKYVRSVLPVAKCHKRQTEEFYPELIVIDDIRATGDRVAEIDIHRRVP
jgi:hypothetical protein